VAISRTIQIPLQGMTTVGWLDGAMLSNGHQSGVGGLIRLNDKTIYKWTYNCGPSTNTREELLGVWDTLSLAVRLNIDVLQVFGDSKIVIDWLNNRGNCR